MIACTASAVFASRRSTWSANEAIPPESLPADEIAVMDTTGFPAWFKNYEIRVSQGGTIFDGKPQDNSNSVTWIRDGIPRSLDFLSLTAMSDSFLPRVFLRRRKFSPIGTVSMTTYFHATTSALNEHGTLPLLGAARGQRFSDGFFDQTASLWSHSGELLVTAHQMVYYKD